VVISATDSMRSLSTLDRGALDSGTARGRPVRAGRPEDAVSDEAALPRQGAAEPSTPC
jgi:hypothetical protein